MIVRHSLKSIVAISLLHLSACTGMKSTDSLEAVRAAKVFRQQQLPIDQKNDDGLVKKKNQHGHDHQDHSEDHGHGLQKHGDEQHHHDDHNQERTNLSIVEMEAWYDSVTEHLVDQLENKELRQLVIWQAQQKVWARAALTEANQMLFFSCEAHQGHIDCQQLEKEKAPDIPVFANKEDE